MELLGPDAFEGATLLRPGTWAIDFSADWCPYCHEFLPLFASLDGRREYDIAVADVSDLESPLWDTFGVEVVPTVVVFREGKAVFRANGRSAEGLDAKDLEAVRGALRAPGRPAAGRRRTPP